LENDTLVIGKDDVRKVLDDVATALQDKMKSGLDDQYDKIKQEMIRRKQEDLLSLESQTDAALKRVNDEGDKEVDMIQKEGDKERKDLAELGETLQNELKTATKAEKEEQYIDSKQSK
jgi:hypothetical protein